MQLRSNLGVPIRRRSSERAAPPPPSLEPDVALLDPPSPPRFVEVLVEPKPAPEPEPEPEPVLEAIPEANPGARRGRPRLTPLPPRNRGLENMASQVRPESVSLPSPTVDPNEEGSLYDEQQLARVELAMLQGMVDSKSLRSVTGINDLRQIDRLKRRVMARWEIVGTANDLRRVRGEGLARLNMVERKLWQIINSAGKGPDGARLQLMALQQLSQFMSQRDLYNGVTQKSMELVAHRTEGSEVAIRMAKQSKLASMAKALMGFVAEAQKESERVPPAGIGPILDDSENTLGDEPDDSPTIDQDGNPVDEYE